MKGRKLRPDEQSLWEDIARSATPLDNRPHPLPAKPIKSGLSDRKPGPEPISPFEIKGRRSGAGVQIHAVPSISDSLRAAPVAMDFKTYKRMSRGKLAPEARIDLHGMTTARAQPALSGFIHRSHAQGLRLVLVITGKGRRSDDLGPMPQRLGVLRHEVPMWLNRAPLAGLVQQITPANQRHGGHGAYYVYLRRR